MTNDRRLLVSSCALVIVLLAGCTPGVASPQTTPAQTTSTMPSTSPTSIIADSDQHLEPDSGRRRQGRGGLLRRRGSELLRRPFAIHRAAEATAALKPLTGQDMLDGNITLFRQLKADGQALRRCCAAGLDRGVGGVRQWCRRVGQRDGLSRPTGTSARGSRRARSWPRSQSRSVSSRCERTPLGFRVVGEKEGFGATCP